MLDIFDILGPVMVGPSSSHTAGAVRIGRMVRVLLARRRWRPGSACLGPLRKRDRATDGPGSGGGAAGMKPDDLEIPHSFSLAEERGLWFSFYTANLREAHPNTAVLEVRDAAGRTLTLQAASTGGGRIRVDRLNGVDVSFTGMFNTLVVQHQDIAGKVADVTRALSSAKINIANMSVCRDRRGGDALMVIETDQKVPPVVRVLIGELRGIRSLTYYEKEE